MDPSPRTSVFPSGSQSRDFLMGSSSRTSSIDGVLDIALHHARDIHNICIYGNQDVYAKFSTTHSQDAVYSTQPIRGGGKNPVFNQSLQVPIPILDAVLKCEIWMMSCAKTYLEDQLLGFVLVPLSDLFGKGRVTMDYLLSSTDLFHTPAGILCLSLTFYLRGGEIPVCVDAPMSSIHGLATVDSHTHSIPSKVTGNGKSDDAHGVTAIGNPLSTAAEYNNIEFPDLQSVCEDQRLVSLYLKMASRETHRDEHGCGEESDMGTCPSEGDFSGASFLQLGSSSMRDCDYEMSVEKREEASYLFETGSLSKGSALSLDCPLSKNTATISTETLKTEEVNPLDSKPTLSMDVSIHFTQESSSSQATLGCTSLTSQGRTPAISQDTMSAKLNGEETHSGFVAPVVSMPLEPEEPVIQQQIVDMYMKSMQQFTESLAMMKLPVLENAGGLRGVESEPRAENEGPTSEPSTKDGHRVFYGSRAFF